VGRRPEALGRLSHALNSPLLTTAVMDLNKPESVSLVARKYGPLTKLVHLAAQVDAGAIFRDHISGNVTATLSTLAALREDLDQIVNLSSIEVYGIPQSLPIGEDHETSPDTYYGAGKLACEKFIQVVGMETGAIVTSLRCASIYGPGETIRRASTVFLDNVVQGKPLWIAGDGSDLRDYVYVEDVARAVILALEMKKPGVFNLGGDQPLSIKQIAETIIKISGKNIPMQYGERSKPRYDLLLNNAKIRAELGFEPQTTMEKGLEAQYQSLVKRMHF